MATDQKTRRFRDPLRRHLRGELRNRDLSRDDRKAVRVALRKGNDAILDRVAEELRADRDEGTLALLDDAAKEGERTGRFAGLFKWFKANGPAILAAVLKIVAMFGGGV